MTFYIKGTAARLFKTIHSFIWQFNRYEPVDRR